MTDKALESRDVKDGHTCHTTMPCKRCEKFLAFAEAAAKRSTYHWSQGGSYSSGDFANEGSIELANRILDLISNDTKDEQ